MPTKPEMETRTVEELQRDAAALVRGVAETRQPVRIAADGQPPVVLLDEATYDWYIHLINLSRALNAGMADVREGRVQPLDEFFEELERAQDIPSPARSKGRK
jgi:PHD/YefM family antitoxin component YafN of YafNO toxin-antitoxin module